MAKAESTFLKPQPNYNKLPQNLKRAGKTHCIATCKKIERRLEDSIDEYIDDSFHKSFQSPFLSTFSGRNPTIEGEISHPQPSSKNVDLLWMSMSASSKTRRNSRSWSQTLVDFSMKHVNHYRYYSYSYGCACCGYGYKLWIWSKSMWIY